MRRNPTAMVVGDGPVGLCHAIALKQAGYDVTLFSDRRNYSRKHELSFSADDFAEIAEFLGVVPPNVNAPEYGGDYDAYVAAVSRRIRELKDDPVLVSPSSTPEEQSAAAAHTANRDKTYINLTDPNEEGGVGGLLPRPGRFSDSEHVVGFDVGESVSIQSKHLEQALMAVFQQRSSVDEGRADIVKVRRGDNAVKKLDRETGEVTFERPSRRPPYRPVVETVKPDMLVVATGGNHDMVDMANAANEGKAGRKVREMKGRDPIARPEHPFHSVNVYRHQASSGRWPFSRRIDNPEASRREFNRVFRNQALVKPPSRKEWLDMGWTLPRVPSRRIFFSKDGLYVGCETPPGLLKPLPKDCWQQALNGDKKAIGLLEHNRKQLEKWQRLVMRLDLPDSFIKDSQVKLPLNEMLKEREKVIAERVALDNKKDQLPKAAYKALHRKLRKKERKVAKHVKRCKLQFAVFDVTCDGGYDKPHTVVGGDDPSKQTHVLVTGDTYEGHRTDFKTRQGARFGIKQAVALRKRLADAGGANGFRGDLPTHMAAWSGDVKDIRDAKTRLTSDFQEALKGESRQSMRAQFRPIEQRLLKYIEEREDEQPGTSRDARSQAIRQVVSAMRVFRRDMSQDNAQRVIGCMQRLSVFAVESNWAKAAGKDFAETRLGKSFNSTRLGKRLGIGSGRERLMNVFDSLEVAVRDYVKPLSQPVARTALHVLRPKTLTASKAKSSGKPARPHFTGSAAKLRGKPLTAKAKARIEEIRARKYHQRRSGYASGPTT